MEGGLSMAVWNIVNRTDFRSHANIMAEHYQLERIRAEEYLKSISTYRIKDLYKEVIQIISPSKLEDSWNVYDLTDGISNFLTTEPHYTKSSSAKKVAVENDFVISRLRSYLKEMAVVPNCNYKMAFSTEYLVYRPKQSISSSILLPFSLSSYVQSILKWAQMGNEHPRFSSETFGEIFIPDSLVENSNEISAFVAEAIEFQKQSQTLYYQAEELLAKELQLDQLKLSNKKWYTADYYEAVKSKRLDSTHFRDAYSDLFDFLENRFLCKKIGQIVSVNRRGLQPVYFGKGTVMVVNSKHLSATHILYDQTERTTEEEFSRQTVAQIKNGDVLIYTTGAYIGLTNAFNSQEKALASNHVNILRLSDTSIDPNYLALVMNSKIGKLQTEKHSRGSAQLELYPADIAKFIIPIISENKMKEIGDLVRNSLSALNQSKQLLAQAKRRVEELIEQEANKYK